MDYDDAVEAIHAINPPLIEAFQAWLNAKGMTAKMIQSHLDPLHFFAEYRVYVEPLRPLDQATAHDVDDFLSDGFPRKAAWACVSNTQVYWASFRKFFIRIPSRPLLERP
ncbi:MAG: integrase [Candidatus Competibacteraceae bacterium]|nr:integrase [Candidatus Competibacteraceae bacterium]HPE71697.1 integrase [Candidatus Competibacter sp.]HRY18729.1 integrase [Candidatus Competibacteraceae bacterium]